MDKRNKNIEDFFNKSLEQFSDVPSNRVWAGIAQELEKDILPFYKRWTFWLGTFTGIAILLLMGYGYFSMKSSIDLLTLRTNQLAEENQELKLALTDCSVVSERLIFENETQSSEESKEVSTKNILIDKAGNQVIKSKNNSVITFFAPSFFRPIENFSYSDVSKKEGLPYSNTADIFSIIRFRNGLTLNTLKNEVTTDSTVNELIDDNKKMPLSIADIAAIKESRFYPLEKLENKQIGARRVKTTFRRKLPNTFIDYVPLNLTQPIKHKLDYKFGITLGWMNTFTDKKDLFGPGYNIGITNELQLSNRIYLTGAINFVQQNYEIKLDASNQAILQTYPNVEELTNVVTSINQHAHILEIPVGLKWYLKEKENRTKFYINPAVAWQFYFPQKFVYEQASNTGIIPFGWVNKQYFGYFGTAQIQVGMERPLFKKMHYQVGLWAEKSLVPLGIEDRNLFNLGIRGAIFLN